MALSVKVVEEPEHKPLEVPIMEEGNGLTINGFFAVTVPHPLVTWQLMVSGPADTPIRKPENKLALPLERKKVPPTVVSANVPVAPTQMPVGADIGDTVGNAFTVMYL